MAIIEKTFVIRHLLNKHLRALSGGDAAVELIKRVKSHIYQPGKDDSNHRRIPIRMITAARDRAVDAADKAGIEATFNELRAHELEYGHGGIKRPDSTAEDRYRAVVDDLKDLLAVQFRSVCEQCMANDPIAPGEFWRSYEPVVRYYYDKFGGRKHKDDYAQFVRAVWNDGAARGLPVHDTAMRAGAAMAAQRQFGR